MVNDSNIITIDSIESKMKVNKFSGNHEQKKVKGIQILENTNDGTTGWGWSTSPSNVGVIKEVSYLGTKACKFSLPENSYAWKFLWRNVNRGKLKNNTTYTIQFDAKTNYNENIIIAIQNKAAQNKLVNFGTININGEKRVKVVANSNTIEILDQILYIYADNIANASGRELIITNLILIEGDYSNTDIEWEKYTGLQGSPSLDYPSPVRAVGDNGSVEIKKINKNWAKIDTPHTVERSGLNIEVDNEGVFTLNGTTTANMYINLINIEEYQNTTLTNYKLPLKKYKAYFDLIQKNNSAVSESNGDASFNIRNFAASSTGEQVISYCVFGGLIKGNTGVQIKDCNITDNRIVTYLYVANGVKLDNFKFRFALYNEDETDTTYEKYEESSYILDIQKPMLLGDYFVKEADGWKEVHTWNKVVLTGNENSWSWNTDNFQRVSIYVANGLNNPGRQMIYSNNFIYGASGNNVGIGFLYASRLYLYYPENITSLEDWKALLQEKYNSGNPVYVYYPLATSTKLPCTDEQITVLNQLQNIILYDDTTNIVLPDVYPILDYDVSKIIDTTTTFEASLDSNGYFVVPDYDIKCLISYSESDIPSMPEAVESTVRVAGKDGDVVLGTTYEPISFTIVCYTDDNLSVEEKNAEELKMNNFLNSIKDKTIRLKIDSKDIFYNVKYNGLLTTINYPKHLQFSIPLKSSSSYAKDIDESYILGNGEKESSTIKEVGAVFVIEGPAQTPKISLNDYEMFYDNVLLSNTKLVIDSNKSTVTMINREGTATNAMRYYNHEFPKIQNGNNVLKVLSGIDEDRQVNVRWFDLKL